MKKKILAGFLSGLWISLSEFVRNELLFKSYWIDKYAHLNLQFPSSNVNNAVGGGVELSSGGTDNLYRHENETARGNRRRMAVGIRTDVAGHRQPQRPAGAPADFCGTIKPYRGKCRGVDREKACPAVTTAVGCNRTSIAEVEHTGCKVITMELLDRCHAVTDASD